MDWNFIRHQFLHQFYISFYTNFTPLFYTTSIKIKGYKRGII